ncbi:hypothetical protein KDH_03040 [Dictyobacter sp. S3.2.2.5]|uniref:AB hydrolase-1 domain-containing protein n=1 Tax=Dictyobacter halimunensis TaxID=3026934 RepID=A0ABQ6FIL8_9CHLR|nr:hypothetical protein KDH_03040 [Dictyobacter sp. S3.2.2.5]
MPTQPVSDTFVTTSRLTHHYVQWGEKGPAIVCAHGLTANAFFFQAIAEDLARDHRVFAYDLRGRGKSDRPEHGYSVPIHAADLSALISALELERPIVLGHSLGALVSLYFAAHYPTQLSQLILADGEPPPLEQGRGSTSLVDSSHQPPGDDSPIVSRIHSTPEGGPFPWTLLE